MNKIHRLFAILLQNALQFLLYFAVASHAEARVEIVFLVWREAWYQVASHAEARIDPIGWGSSLQPSPEKLQNSIIYCIHEVARIVPGGSVCQRTAVLAY